MFFFGTYLSGENCFFYILNEIICVFLGCFLSFISVTKKYNFFWKLLPLLLTFFQIKMLVLPVLLQHKGKWIPANR